MSRFRFALLALFVLHCGAETASAQTTGSTESVSAKPEEAKSVAEKEKSVASEQRLGFALPNTDKLRMSVRFMAEYGYNPSIQDKGFETQGRIGQVELTVFGRLNKYLAYYMSLGAVNEIAPLPACEEAGFLRPNAPTFVYADLYAAGRGPKIDCNPQGTRRVDMYRGIALDMLPQQGAVREAYVDFIPFTNFNIRFGRVAQPVGFTPEEAGSWTAKDAPMIQRLNRDAFFTLQFGYHKDVVGLTVGGSASVISGDSDASKDYGYNKLFNDPSLDGNSGPGAIGEAFVRNSRFDIRASYRHNEMGSKIESLSPSYFGSGKHNDNAMVLSGLYNFSRLNRALVECANYTVGLKDSSAVMVGFNPAPVKKKGCYITLEGGLQLPKSLVVGGSVTREEIDRADALIRYLSEQGMYNIVEGKKDRMLVTRVFVRLGNAVQVGYYYSKVSRPFTWASGITPITGDSAFVSRKQNKWGTVVIFTLK